MEEDGVTCCAGGPLKLSLEDHPFAVFGMELNSEGTMLVTVSNLMVIWDVGSGEVARVVEPELEGIILGLALGPRDAYAAAFTNANTLLIVSLITGEFQVPSLPSLPSPCPLLSTDHPRRRCNRAAFRRRSRWR